MSIRDNEIETVMIWFVTGHRDKFLTKIDADQFLEALPLDLTRRRNVYYKQFFSDKYYKSNLDFDAPVY